MKKLIHDTDYNVYVYPVKKSPSGYEAVGSNASKSYISTVAKTKDEPFKKVATVKSTSYVLKKTQEHQNYYIYVKANGVKCGKKKYSSTKLKYQDIIHIWYSGSKVFKYSYTLKD